MEIFIFIIIEICRHFVLPLFFILYSKLFGLVDKKLVALNVIVNATTTAVFCFSLSDSYGFGASNAAMDIVIGIFVYMITIPMLQAIIDVLWK